MQEPQQKAGYQPGKGEENDVHALIEIPAFDPVTGERRSRPYIQKFQPGAWKQFQANGPRLGYWVQELLYAPRGINTEYHNPDPNRSQVQQSKAALQRQLESLKAQLDALQ